MGTAAFSKFHMELGAQEKGAGIGGVWSSQHSPNLGCRKGQTRPLTKEARSEVGLLDTWLFS